jgi:hypothetical protein
MQEHPHDIRSRLAGVLAVSIKDREVIRIFRHETDFVWCTARQSRHTERLE